MTSTDWLLVFVLLYSDGLAPGESEMGMSNPATPDEHELTSWPRATWCTEKF
jgi:hypothetical protein